MAICPPPGGRGRAKKDEKKLEMRLDTFALWCRILIKGRGDRDGGETSAQLAGKHPGGQRLRESDPPDQVKTTLFNNEATRRRP